MSPDIQYVSSGLGHRIGNKIYLHKDLLDHPKLHGKILDHELRHLRGERDVDINEPFDMDLFRFIIKRPSTWVHFLPIWIQGRKIIYSKVMMILWILMILWIGLIIWYATIIL